MPEVKCKLCSCKSEFIDKYKFNVESDVEYFGKLDIYYCEKCELTFDNDTLEEDDSSSDDSEAWVEWYYGSKDWFTPLKI